MKSGCWARSEQQPHLSCPRRTYQPQSRWRGGGLEHLSLDINPAIPKLGGRHRKTCATWQCFNITRSFPGFTRRASSELRHYRPSSISPADANWPKGADLRTSHSSSTPPIKACFRRLPLTILLYFVCTMPLWKVPGIAQNEWSPKPHGLRKELQVGLVSKKPVVFN